MNVKLFFGRLNAASNPCWLMLTSASSGFWSGGSKMPRTVSVRLTPAGVVMGTVLPTLRFLSSAYDLATSAPSVPSFRSVRSEPEVHLKL